MYTYCLVHQMLEVSVPHHHINMETPELTTAVVLVVAVGINVLYQHLLRYAFKIFQLVNGFIQKIWVTSKHFILYSLIEIFQRIEKFRKL